jgi:hypothetical protein
MKIAESILTLFENVSKSYKGIDYDIVKDGTNFQAEIEREEIEGTKSKNQETTDRKAKQYIDQVI